MGYTKEQILEFKQKADKWDALEKAIEPIYGRFNEEDDEWEDREEYDENDDGGGLETVGELAARAFGFMA